MIIRNCSLIRGTCTAAPGAAAVQDLVQQTGGRLLRLRVDLGKPRLEELVSAAAASRRPSIAWTLMIRRYERLLGRSIAIARSEGARTRSGGGLTPPSGQGHPL